MKKIIIILSWLLVAGCASLERSLVKDIVDTGKVRLNRCEVEGFEYGGVDSALDDGVSPVEAKEALYQTIPYVGMAKAYDFVLAANEVMAEKGIQLPLEGQSRTTPQNRLEKGLAAQKEIFGSHIDEMRASAPAELKHIQDYLSANCFGDYYTRGGLDLKTRELLTFATLISLGGVDSQVRSHVQGNLNMGNGRQVLLDTVTVLLPYIGYPRSLNAIAAVNEIAKE